MCARIIYGVAVAALLFPGAQVFPGAEAFGLPGDIDMYRQQSLKANEVSRAPVAGTVPLGHRPFMMSIEEAAKELKNPVALSLHSAWRGQRLWNANCSTCHGTTGDGKGPVGPLMGVPDLRGDFYKQKTDGSFFAVIHYGLRAMPRYGYKLAEDERWDIINYLRFLQGAQVEGMNRVK